MLLFRLQCKYAIYHLFANISSSSALFFEQLFHRLCFFVSVCRLQEGLKDQTETLALRCDDIMWKHMKTYVRNPIHPNAHNISSHLFFFFLFCLSAGRNRKTRDARREGRCWWRGRWLPPASTSSDTFPKQSDLFGFVMQAWWRRHSDDLIFLSLCYRAALEILVLLVTVEWR